MRTSMWKSATMRWMGGLAAATLLLGLGACGGGGSDAPAFAVSVSVDGVTDNSNPLTAGESTAITVPSGATLTFASKGETRWSPTASDSSYSVNSFSFTTKSLTVSSNTGGSLVVTFTDKTDESQTATLSVTVSPKEFNRVAPREGTIAEWNSTYNDGLGTVTESSYHTRTVLLEDGHYGLDLASSLDPENYYTRSLYDAQDGYLGWQSLGSSTACLYDRSTANVSYPMHVGKAWSGNATRTCNTGATFDVAFTRTVEAYERITVPAGTYDTLRIKSELSYTNVPSPYTVTSTCSWAVEIGRAVKCAYQYHYPGAADSSMVDVLAGLTN